MRKLNSQANVDLILTAITAGVALAVAIPIIFAVAGGIDTTTIDDNLKTNILDIAAPIDTTDQRTDAAWPIDNTTISWVNLTATPGPGPIVGVIYHVSQWNTSALAWVTIPSANWTYVPASNNVSIDPYPAVDNASILRVMYWAENLDTPALTSMNSIVANVGTFFALAPLYLIIIAAVSIIMAIMLLRRR